MLEQKIEHLRCNEIRELELAASNIDYLGIATLIQALKFNESVTSINLSENDNISDAAAMLLAEFLQRDKKVRILNLFNCPIAVKGVQALFKALAFNNTLTDLNLVRGNTSNQIEILIKSLESNSSLKKIALSMRLPWQMAEMQELLHITKTKKILASLVLNIESLNESTAITQALTAGENLTALHLDVRRGENNQGLDLNGVERIFRTIGRLTKLNNLVLTGNFWRENSRSYEIEPVQFWVEPLLKILQQNTTIITLSCDLTPFTFKFYAADFAELFKQNNFLTSLYLGENFTDYLDPEDEETQRFEKALAQNTRLRTLNLGPQLDKLKSRLAVNLSNYGLSETTQSSDKPVELTISSINSSQQSHFHFWSNRLSNSAKGAVAGAKVGSRRIFKEHMVYAPVTGAIAGGGVLFYSISSIKIGLITFFCVTAAVFVLVALSIFTMNIGRGTRLGIKLGSKEATLESIDTYLEEKVGNNIC